MAVVGVISELVSGDFPDWLGKYRDISHFLDEYASSIAHKLLIFNTLENILPDRLNRE